MLSMCFLLFLSFFFSWRKWWLEVVSSPVQLWTRGLQSAKSATHKGTFPFTIITINSPLLFCVWSIRIVVWEKMANHRDPRFLHNLSYHPRWQHDTVEVRRKRHMRTVASNTCNEYSRLKSLELSSLKPQLPCSPAQRSRSYCWNWFLLPLLLVLFLPCQAWGATFKIALVGPWTCDVLYSRALPDLAARLATARINKDPYLNKGYWYDYTLISEDCKSSRALARFAELEGYGAAILGPANPGYCSSAALYAKEWDVGILSWGCLKPKMEKGNMYPTFLRPLPLSSHVLFSVLRYFHWAHVAIISEESDLWEATGQELASSLRALGLPVNPVVTMEDDKEGARRALTKVRDADRVRGKSTTLVLQHCKNPTHKMLQFKSHT